jgi:hypothetical protein
MAEKKLVKGILFVAMLVSVCGVVYIILAYSKYYFHSDCAGFLFLAKEQLVQKKMFPEGFHYTTEIFFLLPNVTMIPFLAFFDNELLAHEMGVLLYIILICILIFKLFWNDKKAAVIVVTLFLFPLSWVVIDMFFSQGAYLGECLFKLLILIAIQYLFTAEEDESVKKAGIVCVCYLATGFLVNYAMIRRIATEMLPILFAFVAMIMIREGISMKKIFKQKKLLLYSVCTFVVIMFSGIHYVLLCNKLEFYSPSFSTGLVDSSIFYQNCLKFPVLILELLGWTSTSSLFHLSAFKTCVMLVYIIVSQIVIPIYLLSKVRYISNRFMQFLVLYVNISNVVTFFVMTASGAMESRYYLPVYFNNLLLLGLIGKWVLDNKYEMLMAVPAIGLLILTVCIHGGYIYSVPNEWRQDINLFDPKADRKFYDFLLENNLAYGYATFWNAYPITVLSNEEVVVVAYDTGKPTVPYYFNANVTENYEYYAISEDYYDPELHTGRCFVLVFPGETIPEQYYQLAEEMLMYESVTILVYENNINEYPELVAACQ